MPRGWINHLILVWQLLLSCPLTKNLKVTKCSRKRNKQTSTTKSGLPLFIKTFDFKVCSRGRCFNEKLDTEGGFGDESLGLYLWYFFQRNRQGFSSRSRPRSDVSPTDTSSKTKNPWTDEKLVLSPCTPPTKRKLPLLPNVTNEKLMPNEKLEAKATKSCSLENWSESTQRKVDAQRKVGSQSNEKLFPGKLVFDSSSTRKKFFQRKVVKPSSPWVARIKVLWSWILCW